MNSTKVTKTGQEGGRPGRQAPPGFGRPSGYAALEGRRYRGRKKRPAEEFTSYYGLPVIKKPVWEAREIAGYFFLGGLAGASSTLALAAQVTGRAGLSRRAKVGAAAAILVSLGALVKDLGRPERFLNMLRVFKPTSPMNVGTWIVSAYAPAAITAAASDVTGLLPGVGLMGTAGAALLGPAVASYTAVLICDTAVPAWHEARAHMPFLFVSSAAMAASGLGLVAGDAQDGGPAQRLALLAATTELAVGQRLENSLAPEVAKAYQAGKPRGFAASEQGPSCRRRGGCADRDQGAGAAPGGGRRTAGRLGLYPLWCFLRRHCLGGGPCGYGLPPEGHRLAPEAPHRPSRCRCRPSHQPARYVGGRSGPA